MKEIEAMCGLIERINKGGVMLTWQDIITFTHQGNPQPDTVVRKSDAQWREQLGEAQYYVMRQHGTERPFSNQMCELFEPGLYRCAGCQNLLFDSGSKFDSRTGWPSFAQPMKSNAISYYLDDTLASPRIEVRCNQCESHLGHVFPDGPAPSGLRYCVNAVSIEKVNQEAS
ncbi:peptide-methionine (R)-S-oxide reductase [Vibrio vulnificus]|nr:peptide-methionine (R)-S-oxide reductase [Vibrio vulnificus]